MIDRLAVVSVVGRARLLAVHWDRKAVDVEGHAPCGMVAARGTQVPFARLAQRIAERGQVAGRAGRQFINHHSAGRG